MDRSRGGMVNGIAVWYHTYINGPTVDLDHGLSIVQEQLAALYQSGLQEACNELYIGVSGGDANVAAVAMMSPAKAVIIEHSMDTCGELPTLCALQQWLPGHEGWAVCYFHTKSAQYKGDAGYRAWRLCQQAVVVWDWQRCVKDLEDGYDCSGAHWLTPQQYPHLMATPYYAGTFWWARADYLSILPKLSPTGPSRWEAEAFIGKANRKIKFRDHRPHWPGGNCLAYI